MTKPLRAKCKAKKSFTPENTKLMEQVQSLKAKEPFNRFTRYFGRGRVVRATKMDGGCAFPSECKRSLYRDNKDHSSHSMTVKRHIKSVYGYRFAKNEDEGCSLSRRRLPDHLVGAGQLLKTIARPDKHVIPNQLESGSNGDILIPKVGEGGWRQCLLSDAFEIPMAMMIRE
ncbi:hypothetical protein H5410_064750 [Solanum commersonii]|uniref:Uncharacterized protein n=1 Tax=Solanum commersonii TaxID=4109 RepID=A0A9J5VZ58_SOLCO|nr:hypothetical protein H5410_064750 [Solanum commersonii]